MSIVCEAGVSSRTTGSVVADVHRGIGQGNVRGPIRPGCGGGDGRGEGILLEVRVGQGLAGSYPLLGVELK